MLSKLRGVLSMEYREALGIFRKHSLSNNLLITGRKVSSTTNRDCYKNWAYGFSDRKRTQENCDSTVQNEDTE